MDILISVLYFKLKILYSKTLFVVKTRKIIYLILGVVLIVLDCIVTFLTAKDLKRHLTNDEYDIGYLLGSQLFLYIGAWLVYRAYKVQQKIKQKNKQDLIYAFE